MFLLYNLLLTVTSPVWVVWMVIRTRKRGGQIDWKQRTGDYPFRWKKRDRRIWLHAVSVGEVIAALPLLKELRGRLPEHEIVLSVTTTSGYETAVARAEGLYDHLVYFPIDVLRFSLAALTRVRPEVVVIMETELWPNFLWSAETLGAKVVVANGRLSDRSFPRAMWIRPLYRWALAKVDLVLAQSGTDAERFRALGAKTVEVGGNVKFDGLAEAGRGRAFWRDQFGAEPTAFLTIVGSLRAEEFREAAPAILEIARHGPVVVAPRHIERVDELAALLGDPPRRSSGGRLVGNLLLLDTYGELGEAYSAADLAIVGGGFADLGGQNILQPLEHGVPTIHGPYMRNFRDVVGLASASGATLTTPISDLAAVVTKLRDDATKRGEMAVAARELVLAHKGASARTADRIADLVSTIKAT